MLRWRCDERPQRAASWRSAASGAPLARTLTRREDGEKGDATISVPRTAAYGPSVRIFFREKQNAPC
jgi:hypothetical protein